MPRLFAYFFVILSTLFWGANFTVGKYIVGYVPPMLAAAVRFGLASVMVSIMLLCTQSIQVIAAAIKQHWKAYSVIGVVGIVGFNGLFFLGLKYTTAVNAALIMGTNPIITLVLAAAFFKTGFRLKQTIGMLVSLVGVLVVVSNGSLYGLLHLQIAKGDVIIMMANVSWALYGVLCRHYLYSSPPLVTTAMTMIVGALALCCLVDTAHPIHLLLTLPRDVDFALLYIALLGTVFAYLFWNIGLMTLGVAETAIFLNLVPVAAVVIANILGQPISALQLVGGITVLVGVMFSTSRSLK